MAIQEPLEPPKVLLLKNYPSASPSDTLMINSFLTNIQNTIPNAQLDICCIANGEQIPDLSNYRLVILSGGKVNLLEAEKPLWALQVLDMIRKVAKEPTGPKLLGICWGHQAIQYALGGDLAWVKDGPRVSCVLFSKHGNSHFADEAQIGVQDIQLTAQGQQVFKSSTLVSNPLGPSCTPRC